ncbi:heme ABC transporter ATP-binding protein [Exilibacterium tricleocarpae]|uniref:Heme ABC transporter ATP-binding protein n=2 Tax=Exilibacterium tricleocarpae TaxID=2591008 RepID=A0A545U4A5_9GAMM|nr:heme ABC transporter ATP-binding protein [Exilibacterium tricleocarpae]
MALQAVTVKTRRVTLLSGVSLSLAAGQVLAVIGANGAGKTSLLRTLTGELAATSGTLSVCGAAPTPRPTPRRARHLAVLPQLSLLNFPYTAEEVVNLGRTPHNSGIRVDRDIVAAALAAMDIEHLRGRLYPQLSGGEKQRVQLARVMAQVWRGADAEPRLLLLDEPTTALDLGHQHQLMAAIRRFAAQGVAVVMVVHDLNLAARYADRLLALHQGRALAAGTVPEVLTAAVIRQLFNVDVRVVKHPDTGKPEILGL